MKKKKRKRRFPSCFVFSPAMIQLAREAMQCFERALQRMENRPEKRAFAQALMQQVNRKLDAMQIPTEEIRLIPFDYNEKLVLGTAVQLYSLDVFATPESLQRERALHLCREIERFALGKLNGGGEHNRWECSTDGQQGRSGSGTSWNACKPGENT